MLIIFEPDYFLPKKMFKKASKGYRGAPFCKGTVDWGVKMVSCQPMGGTVSKRRSRIQPIGEEVGPLMRFRVDP